jgi:GNAT superfamily N-acetyltransferase
MTPQGLTIRRARPDDFDAICELADIMDEPQRAALPDRFRRGAGPARNRDRTEALMRDENTFLGIAELQGKVVGVVNSGLEKMPDYPQKQPIRSVKIRGVVVRPELRRKGIATALVRAVEDWAASRGATELQANVYDFNKASFAFFTRLGLAPLSHRLVRRLGAGAD